MDLVCADGAAPTSAPVSRRQPIKIYFTTIPDLKRFINRFPRLLGLKCCFALSTEESDGRSVA
jgi:hypothetical protein